MNLLTRLWIFCLTAVLAVPCDALGQLAPTNGLIAYYPFNGNADDASGHGNNGKINGAVTLVADRFGTPNAAYSFPGLPTNDITIDSTNLLLPTPFFLSLWVNFSGGSYNPRILSVSGGISSSQYSGYAFSTIGTGASRRIVMTECTPTVYGAVSTHYFAAGKWHQISGVWGTNGMSLYVDGALEGTALVPDPIWYTCCFGSDWLPTIGNAAIFSALDLFAGRIDDVRIYNRALSAEEIQQLYLNESLPPCIPHRATATATVVDGVVVGATITDGGCGYTNTPLVLIQGGGGTGATAVAVVSNGVVVGITITDAGVGYANVPSIYLYAPSGPQITLLKALKPAFSDLFVGTNYQLQVSVDLSTWTNLGPPFAATNSTMAFPQYWDVESWNQLFFRLRVAP